MCPGEGHHPFSNDSCENTFVKCSRNYETNEMEGTMYRCPSGYSYWRVSRRCEKTEKLSNCSRMPQTSRLINNSNGIPVEWINLGKARQLRF